MENEQVKEELNTQEKPVEKKKSGKKLQEELDKAIAEAVENKRTGDGVAGGYEN